jgi:RNA polymerase sigma factor (sigma-70 family)
VSLIGDALTCQHVEFGELEDAEQLEHDRKAFYAALAELPTRWQKILRYRLAGLTLDQIGVHDGTTKECVRQLLVRGLARIQKAINPTLDANTP